MNINDVGYNVTIGEPVVDAKGVADSGLSFPCKAIPDGDYLVTLEVNGTVIAGRDKATFASGSATVGDYTLSYSSYAVSVATLTDDDVVVLRIEPLDVKVSDAFRAVVGKAAPAPAPQNVVYIKVGDTFTAEEFAALKKHVSDGGCVICGIKEESTDLMYYSSYAYAGADYIIFQFNCTSIETDNAYLYVQNIVVNAYGWNSPIIHEYVLTAKT